MVVHRISIQMFKNKFGCFPNAFENLVTANDTVHSYITCHGHKLRGSSCRGIHQYIYKFLSLNLLKSMRLALSIANEKNITLQDQIQIGKLYTIGYEPADLTVHPPPQNDRGWVHFFRIGV